MAIIEFFNIENLIYLALVLSLLVVILLIWNIRLELKARKLMRGKNGMSLEDSFVGMQRDIGALQLFQKEIEDYLRNVEARLSTTLRGFNNHPFDAFKGMDSGGKSFATAFLNEKGDGIIISSMQARDRVGIFAKQVNNYKTEIALSEEENIALTKAKESCKV